MARRPGAAPGGLSFGGSAARLARAVFCFNDDDEVSGWRNPRWDLKLKLKRSLTAASPLESSHPQVVSRRMFRCLRHTSLGVPVRMMLLLTEALGLLELV